MGFPNFYILHQFTLKNYTKFFFKKYKLNKYIEENDLYSELYLKLYDSYLATLGNNSCRYKFNTYFYTVCNNYCKNILSDYKLYNIPYRNKDKYNNKRININNVFYINNENYIINNILFKNIYYKIKNTYGNTYVYIFILYFGKKYKVTDIVKRLHIKKSHIYRIIDLLLAFIRSNTI